MGALAVAAVCLACEPSSSLGTSTTDPDDAGSPGAAPGVAEVDWSEVIYRSACGLSDVEVTSGLGEARSVHGIFGVEVVDADLADLDGDGTQDAAVLLDCLGADGYRPHVVVVDGTAILPDGSVAPAAGGSVGAGARPLRIEADPDGRIAVTVLDRRAGGDLSLIHI